MDSLEPVDIEALLGDIPEPDLDSLELKDPLADIRLEELDVKLRGDIYE